MQIELFYVYITYLARGYICGTQREDQSQCKCIHRTIHIVVVTVTVAFAVGRLSFFIFTILFIRVFLKFIYAMIRGFGFWACIVLCVVFSKLFATTTSDGDELEKSESCGLNCLVFCFLSAWIATNN
jgi:Na+/citrate or Na+/malate symporter